VNHVVCEVDVDTPSSMVAYSSAGQKQDVFHELQLSIVGAMTLSTPSNVKLVCWSARENATLHSIQLALIRTDNLVVWHQG
jgi:hypothetical protein